MPKARLNPLTRLPAARAIGDLPEPARIALGALLRDLGADAERQAQEAWRRRKAPMAAYWRAVGVYARHAARLCIVAPNQPRRWKAATCPISATGWHQPDKSGRRCELCRRALHRSRMAENNA